jgi:hypothetical protein
VSDAKRIRQSHRAREPSAPDAWKSVPQLIQSIDSKDFQSSTVEERNSPIVGDDRDFF